MVSTDGSAIIEPRTHYRVAAMAQSVADDGMELMAYDYIDFVDRFPDKQTLTTLMSEAIKTAIELRTAPAVDPFVGPAILSEEQQQCSFMKFWASHRRASTKR